jgi:hypothetical protein
MGQFLGVLRQLFLSSDDESTEQTQRHADVMIEMCFDKLLIGNSFADINKKLSAKSSGYAALRVKEGTFREEMMSTTLPQSLNTLESIGEIVKDFNSSNPDTTEKSGSIENSDSIHFLWKKLLVTLRSDLAVSQREGHIRIVYEWTIPKFQELGIAKIDFTFVDSIRRCISHVDVAGGLELKISRKQSAADLESNTTSKSKESVILKGYPQALKRAVSCVKARWTVAGDQGFHRSSCFYANSHSIGVVRVTVTEDGYVDVDNILPESLPGVDASLFREVSNGADTSFLVLRMLEQVVRSKANSLPYFSSVPPPDLIITSVAGISKRSNVEEQWQLKCLLGVGGFGCVFEDENGCAVKMQASSMDRELKAIRILNKGNTNGGGHFPVFQDALMKDDQIIALKFSQCGIPLNAITKVVIASQRTGDYGVKLIRHVGIRIIEALQIAHTVSKIAHTDIKHNNVILIPATYEEYQRVAPYVFAPDIGKSAGKILELFDLSTCKVVLNDWGNAEFIESKDIRNLFKDDLFQASNLILHMFDMPRFAEFDFIKSENKNIWASNKFQINSFFTAKQIKDFEVCIRKCKYDVIIDLLELEGQLDG